MVEDGVTDIDDVLGDRLAALKSDRDRAKAALERIKVQLAPNSRSTPIRSNNSALSCASG